MVSYFNTNEHVLFEYFRQMGTFIPYVFFLPRRGQRLWKSWQCHHCQLMSDLVSTVLSTAYYVSHRNVICGRLLTVSFNGQTPLLLVTQNIDLQTHKRLNFWATFESLESFGNHLKRLAPRRNLAGKYQREDYYRDFCCKYCRTLLLNMQPSCLRLLTMNLVTAGREYCPQLTYNSSQ